MPTLKEIKGRIGSVKSTLKITSAMKLVSSAKLRKAQNAIEAMRPYEKALQDMLASLQGSEISPLASLGRNDNEAVSVISGDNLVISSAVEKSLPTAIVAIASNSSLCGGFNANVIAKVRSVRRPGDVVFSIGRKMADAMQKDGFPSPRNFTQLSEHPAYAPAAQLVEDLAEDMEKGRYSQVLLVYTHFVSTARQVPVAELLLGKISPLATLGRNDKDTSVISSEAEKSPEDIIIEPGRKELLKELRPKTLKLKLYAALLDSAAAEHAARTVAMQTATDNAENLLQELTLQYNKGRQQKITNEILDLAGGQTE